MTFGNRTFRFALEALLVLIVLFAVALGVFLWRVAEGPVSVAFARDYIEEAISNEADQFYVKFDDIVFSWPDLTGPFQLDVTKLRVQKGKDDDASALNIDNASIGLSRRALFFGHIRPVSVMIKSPSLELVRDADGRLNLFVQNQPVKKEPVVASTTTPGQEIAQLFKDMSTHQRASGNFLSRLDSFIIQDASVAVRDQQFGLSWYLTDLDLSIREHDQGVAAMFSVELPGGRTKTAKIESTMVYRKDTNDFKAEAHFENINPYFVSKFMPVAEALNEQDLFFSGDLETSMDENMVLTAAKFHGAIPEGQIVIPSQFEAPVALKDITIDSEYSAKDDLFTLSGISGSVGGIPFTGEGSATFTDTALSVPIKLNVQTADLSSIPSLFPKSEMEGEAHKWLAENLSGGTFSDVALSMELTGVKKHNEEEQRDVWDVDLPKMKLDFAFEGVKVNYSSTLMPAEDAKGHGTLDLGEETLVIEGDSARLGDITGTDITVKVTDLMKAGAGMVYVTAKAKGPLATALDYIAAAPISIGKERTGIDPRNVKGTVDLDLDISLPTLKDVPKEQVNVKVSGTASDLNIPNVVAGLSVAGGPLSIATEDGGFRVKGNTQLEGRAGTVEWHQYFDSKDKPYSMQIKAQIGADKELRNRFGVNLDDYITGTLPVDVVYTAKGADSSVEVKGDLNPVRVYIKPFKFEKPVGTPGTIALKATLKNDVLKDISGLEIASKDFAVSKGQIGFAPLNGKKSDISKGTFPDITIGKSKMKADLAVGKNNVMTITAKGSVFDANPFLQETESSTLNVEAATPKAKVQPMSVSLTADKMLLKNDQTATNARVSLDMDDDGDITRVMIDAGVGKSPLMVRFTPDETGKRIFRLQTDDAGNALFAMGLYENVHGGKLIIYGEPKGGDLRGDLYGSMRMENFRVVKAPALASLLSLMSLTGVTQLLSNEGLVFSKLESAFEWRFRPNGNLLVINDGKTSGSSIGLTFGGTINRGTKMTDISGTIIPMTEINSIIAKIPVLGNILGGDTGLIAATYTMRGPTSDPKVMVNPLSVLAPGFLRNILFEGGYKSSIPDEDDKKPAVKAAPKKAATN